MSRTEHLLQELRRLDDGPTGTAQVAGVEAVVDAADTAGDDLVSAAARQSLVDALFYTFDAPAMWSPFSWLLARYDEGHRYFDEQATHRLLWHFKWVIGSLVRHPGVPLYRAEQVLTSMAEHYARAGEGDQPVLRLRQSVTDHVHGAEAGEPAWRAAAAAPRTGLSDCEGCDPTADATHLIALGDLAGALRHAWPVLDREVGCSEQPHAALSVTLPALLQLGHRGRAAREHVRSVHGARNIEHLQWTQPAHVLVCARTGRLGRGLDLLEEALPRLRTSASPWHRLELAAAGARLLSGVVAVGAGDEPVRAGHRPDDDGTDQPGKALVLSAATLGAELARTATGLADAFDRRNATSTVGQQVRSWLHGDELPDLPLERTLLRPRRHPALHVL